MISITMPKLGESVVEGTVIRWLKQEGQRVVKYEPLVEVMTDKVNSEVPSPEAGVLARIVVPEGQTVKVGTAIAVLEALARPGAGTADRGAAEGVVAGEPARPGGGVEVVEVVEVPPPIPEAPAEVREAPQTPAGETAGMTFAAVLRRGSSPLVRRLAKEHGIDVSAVPGTGMGGRVRKEDLLAYIEGQRAAVPAPAPPPAMLMAAGAAPSPPAAEAGQEEELLPTTPMRRAIAEHMVRSVTTVPHAWTYIEVDVGGLVKWREQLRAEFRAREGYDLSYVPFVAKAVVEGLRGHPVLNSTWRDGQVVLKKRIHLGVAVALEDGLIVPVIRDADARSIAGLARALHDLVTRARAGNLAPEDVQGGTFTLNNTGALGSVLSMPIINQPQAAILTMEAIAKRVVVTADDAVAVRPLLNLCLSFDHRVCDGLQVGRFLQAVKGRLVAMVPGESIY